MVKEDVGSIMVSTLLQRYFIHAQGEYFKIFRRRSETQAAAKNLAENTNEG